MSAKKPPSKNQPPTVVDPLQRRALDDPLLRLARDGAVPSGSYDEAWDALQERQPGDYCPDPGVADYVRLHRGELLSEPPAANGIDVVKRGRPTLLTPELLEQIAGAAEDGVKDPPDLRGIGNCQADVVTVARVGRFPRFARARTSTSGATHDAPYPYDGERLAGASLGVDAAIP